MWDYKQPVRILFGEGRLRELNTEIALLGKKRGLLVTSEGFIRRGVVENIRKNCEGLVVAVFTSVSPNPDVQECDKCASLAREANCDFIIALGGGSVLDCAKAVATLCLTAAPTADYLGTGKALPPAHIPLIAIPTTSGTGSEVSSVSVLSDHERGIKAAFSSENFYPKVAIIDPELTYSVPPYLTACTGFDVICHAIEAYWNKHHQPACDALAVHALRLALENIETAYHEPQNKLARRNMAESSVLAGLAFTLPKTSAPHACSYPLTNRLGIPHGEACALTMPHFIRYNASHGDPRTTSLAHLVGFPDAEAMAQHFVELQVRTNLRTSLHDFHLEDATLSLLVAESQHPNILNNPVPVSTSFLQTMYEELHHLRAV